MRTGVFLFGGVEMSDAGSRGPDPLERRHSQAEFLQTHHDLLECGVLAESLGYDSFWLTEHHFQYEGYEVVPNGILFGAFLAARTQKLRIGSMFNVVGQWHPLRLAEDFSMLHNLSGGRGILGVGRGTVPREMLPLTADKVSVGSFDNPDARAADAINREVTEESLDILSLAMENDEFSYQGTHFQLPPKGIPDRGGETETLTLIPRPMYPYETWQAVTSPPTLAAVPARGIGGVFWLKEQQRLIADWNQFASNYDSSHPSSLQPGEKRMLVLNVHVGDTREQAINSVRPGHDEFWKFLSPYGWGRGYLDQEGNPAPPGFCPTLEESMAQRVWAVGTPEEVAEVIASYVDALSLTDLILFPGMPGDSYAMVREQMARLAHEVLPLVKERPLVGSTP